MADDNPNNDNPNINNHHDLSSSVSSHSSMPSLMSDDDSDDADDINDDEDTSEDTDIDEPLIPDDNEINESPPPNNDNNPPPNDDNNEDAHAMEDLLHHILNNQDNNPNLEAMDLAEILGILRGGRLPLQPNVNRSNDDISSTDDALKRLIHTLYDTIDEINDLCWINYDEKDVDNKEESGMYHYIVCNKQRNLLNPSYNNTRNRRDQRNAKQNRIPFKMPDSYPFITVDCEYKYPLSHHDDNDNTVPLCVAQWKMNLLAVDPFNKLLFIASGNRVFVYNLAITDVSASNNYSEPIDIIVVNTNINRLKYALLDGDPVVYALDYDGYINVIHCKTLSIHKESNVIPSEEDNSTWSIGVGIKHNRIAVGSNTHCVQIHDCSKHSEFKILKLMGHENNVPSVAYHPNNENKIASASIDGTVRTWNICDRYNIKQKVLDFKTKIDNDCWMWAICWITKPTLYIKQQHIEYICDLRDKIFAFYKQRRRIKNEIKEIQKALNRRHRATQSIQRLIDIVNNATKYIHQLIGLSCLKASKKETLNIQFDSRFNALIKDLEQLQSQHMESMSSVSTHESMPSIMSDDEEMNEIHLADEQIISDNAEIASSQPIMSVQDMMEGNEDDDISQEDEDELVQNIGSLSTPPPSQQGFNQMINYQNDAQYAPIISCLSGHKRNIEEMDDEWNDKEQESDCWTFELVSYHNDTQNNIHCEGKTIRVKNEMCDKDGEEMNDGNDDNELFEPSIALFVGVESSLIDMESEMQYNVKIVNEDTSPFIDWKFKSNTMKLSAEVSDMMAEFIVLYKELVHNECVDKPNDVKPEIMHLMLCRVEEFYKLYVSLRSFYISWKKEWNNIEKRKQMILSESENRIESVDYLIACSQSNVYLISASSMNVVDCIEDIMNDVIPSGCHRLEYVEYIDELCVLIVSSYACNRFALIRIVNKYESESEPMMIVEGFYPRNEPYKDDLGSIMGMECVKCSDGMWRLYVLYEIMNDNHFSHSGVAVKLVSFLISHHPVNTNVMCHNCNASDVMQCLM